MGSEVIYEKPFKESMRLCLSIEKYHQQVLSCLAGELNATGAQLALGAMMHLMNVVDRSDIKPKIASEIASSHQKMTHLVENPNINHSRLEVMLDRLNGIQSVFAQSPSILAKPLVDDVFLMQLRQSAAQGGGVIDVGSPIYLAWQNQSTEALREQFNHWLYRLEHLWEAVSLILMLARNSHDFASINCELGFYRDSMIGKNINQVQLIRVACEEPGVYPVISLAKHWVAITFYQGLWNDGLYHATQYSSDTSFSLAICSA